MGRREPPVPVDLGDQPTIAVVKLGDLGDVLLVTPLLDALRTRYPGARILAVARASGAEVLTGNPAVDRTVIVPASRGLGSVAATLRSALTLRREAIDALVIAHHLTLPSGARNQRCLAAVVNAGVTVGLDNGRGSFLTHRLRDRGFGAIPEWQYWLGLGGLLGAPARGRPYVAISTAARAAAAEMLAPLGGRPMVAIHPVVGAYGPSRAWPLDRFAAVASNLDAAGYGIILVGGLDALPAARRMFPGLDTPVNLAGQTSIAELAAVLDRAALVIGADSGVVHLAATLNRPTLALFGPSNHRAWAPFGAQWFSDDHQPPSTNSATAGVQVLRTGLPCSPCFYIGHTLGRPNGCSTRSCLADLSVEAVVKVARRMLMSGGGVEYAGAKRRLVEDAATREAEERWRRPGG